MIFINIISFVLISYLQKDHSVTQTHRLKRAIFLESFKLCPVKKDYKDIQ